ncbi:MAG: hypothetical protein FJ217_07745 [Ignavibacteria bacterium]|nr:hypothetical protein [Ignavibacteria bacterium]
MADQTVRIEPDSRERVAFDLMKTISQEEAGAKDRKYFFILYRQCYKATHGFLVKPTLETDEREK